MTTGEEAPALKPGRIVRFAHGGPMGVLPAAACGAGCGVTVEPAAPAGYVTGVTGVCCAACCDRAESPELPPAAEPDAPAAGVLTTTGTSPGDDADTTVRTARTARNGVAEEQAAWERGEPERAEQQVIASMTSRPRPSGRSIPPGSIDPPRRERNMALKRGQRIGGGGFLDLRELAADGPVLCIFRIREFEAAEKATGFDGTNVPVVADVLICDGPRRGEVHSGERFIGAITAALRGVPNPKKDKGIGVLPPENAVGDEIVLRVDVINRGKANAGAVGNEPSDADYAAAEAVHDGGKGWDVGPATAPREPVGAGVSGGASKRPW